MTDTKSAIFQICEKQYTENLEVFKEDPNKMVIITIIGSRFIPDNGSITKIFCSVLDPDSSIIGEIVNGIALPDSDLMSPEYKLTIPIPAAEFKDKETAYINLFVISLETGEDGKFRSGLLGFNIFNLFVDSEDLQAFYGGEDRVSILRLTGL